MSPVPYSEEAFIWQVREKGGASFNDFPCPVHGHYSSSINLSGFGISSVCCHEQVLWAEAEVKRLGLQDVLEEHRARAKERERRWIEENKIAIAESIVDFNSNLLGAEVIGYRDADASGFKSIIVEKNGKRYSIFGDDGVFFEEEINEE